MWAPHSEVVGLRRLDWHDLRPGEDAEALVRGLVVAGDEIGTVRRTGGKGCPRGLHRQDSNRARLAGLNLAIRTPDLVFWAREGHTRRVRWIWPIRRIQVSESRSHKTTANRLAARYNTEYNRGPGADIKAEGITIEVETPDTVADAGRQLSGHRGPVYVAGTNQKAVEQALDRYEDSTIGVMDNRGNIIKPSTR